MFPEGEKVRRREIEFIGQSICQLDFAGYSKIGNDSISFSSASYSKYFCSKDFIRAQPKSPIQRAVTH